ncbi:hypothetical protein QC999_gp35 [Microbacterium phage Cressida]|uniref:Uncharacterized protein n=1 Tax=Microbacterium phage Cressida TaxID=2591216 RepID=A0A514DI94_9CAUD|nr:hypothetical protein QC999_gp35 [Microbacterium phage Cressida]QDH93315.1 hypothetical protein PBI_CRESSIDA_73 [Microbacterium phage Cressida]
MSAWSGTIAVEGRPTDDGRMLMPGRITWPDLPMPLREPDHGEEIGTVQTITREGDLLRATGTWNEAPEEIGLAINILGGESQFATDGAVMVVTGGRIAGVYTSENPAWPEARMDPTEPTT